MTTVTDNKRLKILSDDEINVLYARPSFTPEERSHYFTLSLDESRAFRSLTIRSRLQCILELGYFKARVPKEPAFSMGIAIRPDNELMQSNNPMAIAFR